MKRSAHMLAVLAGLGLVSASAFADDQPAPDPSGSGTTVMAPEKDPGTIGAGRNPSNLPPPKSSHDPQPEVAAPGMPEGGIVKQAGVGGTTAYGRAGVLELGGSAGLTAANKYTQVSVAPSLGWFFMDDFEVSAIFGLNYAKSGNQSNTLFTALVEPSFHLPFSKTVFGFLGVGGGLGYVNGPGAGFALQPRLGANLLIGRSGVLTPALFMDYTTHSATETPNGTLLAVSTAFGVQVGYTVMW